jgi:MFS family permease
MWFRAAGPSSRWRAGSTTTKAGSTLMVLYVPGREQEAVMSALSITNPAPSERGLTGGILFLLAGLAALGALATNIILPAFPRIGAGLGVSSQELRLTLSSFFVAFALGQLLVGPLSDRFGRKWLVLGGLVPARAGSGADHDCGGGCAGLFASARKCA